ncbi:PA domain-containing protein [Streptosporangium lutulentum]
MRCRPFVTAYAAHRVSSNDRDRSRRVASHRESGRSSAPFSPEEFRMRARRELLAAITAVAAVVLPVALPFPSGAEADRGTSVPAPRTSDLTASPAHGDDGDQTAHGAAPEDRRRQRRHPRLGHPRLRRLRRLRRREASFRRVPGHRAELRVPVLPRHHGTRVQPGVARGQDLHAQGRFQDHDLLRLGERHGSRGGVDLVLPPTPRSSSTSGCEESDFAGFTRGNIALIQRGACSFQIKAELAQAAAPPA